MFIVTLSSFLPTARHQMCVLRQDNKQKLRVDPPVCFRRSPSIRTGARLLFTVERSVDALLLPLVALSPTSATTGVLPTTWRAILATRPFELLDVFGYLLILHPESSHDFLAQLSRDSSVILPCWYGLLLRCRVRGFHREHPYVCIRAAGPGVRPPPAARITGFDVGVRSPDPPQLSIVFLAFMGIIWGSMLLETITLNDTCMSDLRLFAAATANGMKAEKAGGNVT